MTYQHRAETELGLEKDWSSGARSLAIGKTLSTEAHEILDQVRAALGHDLAAANASIARLAALINRTADERADPVPARGGLAPWQKRKVLEYIEDMLDVAISVDRLAGLASLSTSHFSRAFKESTGQTPHAYILGMRIKRAQELMVGTSESLSQISVACGLADQAHLSRTFRRLVGQSPHVWRRTNAERATLRN